MRRLVVQRRLGRFHRVAEAVNDQVIRVVQAIRDRDLIAVFLVQPIDVLVPRSKEMNLKWLRGGPRGNGRFLEQ